MKQSLKPYLEEFCNDKVHTLAKFGCFITLYGRVLRFTCSLGWKNQVKPYIFDSLICEHILEKNIHIAKLAFYMTSR
jgi:hypothetical protein